MIAEIWQLEWTVHFNKLYSPRGRFIRGASSLALLLHILAHLCISHHSIIYSPFSLFHFFLMISFFFHNLSAFLAPSTIYSFCCWFVRSRSIFIPFHFGDIAFVIYELFINERLFRRCSLRISNKPVRFARNSVMLYQIKVWRWSTFKVLKFKSKWIFRPLLFW